MESSFQYHCKGGIIMDHRLFIEELEVRHSRAELFAQHDKKDPIEYTTLAIGEEGGDRYTTMAIGEEGGC